LEIGWNDPRWNELNIQREYHDTLSPQLQRRTWKILL
jgi:hypothetical protein